MNELVMKQDRAWFGRLVDWTGFLLLMASVFTVYLPGGSRSIAQLLALIYVYRERELISVDPEFKKIAWLLLLYILVFTLFSTEWGRSVKGAYDMIRGFFLFYVAYVLAVKLEDPNKFLVFTLTAMLMILGSLAFPRSGGFYGYHVNPNNIAVTLLMFTILALPMFARHALRGFAWLLAAVAVVSGIYLLVLANSRGAWLGLFAALAVLIYMLPGLRRWQRLALLGVPAVGVTALMLFANIKGFSLNLRDEIWLGLLDDTLREHPWFGYGLNSVKDVMTDLDLPALTAHNLFLEIFVSSGFAGLLFMGYVMVRMARHLASLEYRHNTPFYMGVLGVVAYLTMAQFDLKMSSFRFAASIALFLGLLYSQRVIRR